MSDPYVPHPAVDSPPRSPMALATAVVVLAVVWTALQLASFATSFAAAAAFTAADDVGAFVVAGLCAVLWIGIVLQVTGALTSRTTILV